MAKVERCGLCGKAASNLRGRSECVNPSCPLYNLPMLRGIWNRLQRAIAKKEK